MNLLHKKIKDFKRYKIDENSSFDETQYQDLSKILKKIALVGQKSTNISGELKENVEKIISDFRETNKVVKDLNKELKNDNKAILKGILGYLDTFETLYLLKDDIKDKYIKDTIQVCLSVYEQTNELLNIHEIKAKVGDLFNGDIHNATNVKEVKDINLDKKIVEITKVGFVRGKDIIRKTFVVIGKYTGE
tara:strand:- start:143 stop:715 length:573 start_codon:yes stop_codon:yes gene_type:complete